MIPAAKLPRSWPARRSVGDGVTEWSPSECASNRTPWATTRIFSARRLLKATGEALGPRRAFQRKSERIGSEDPCVVPAGRPTACRDGRRGRQKRPLFARAQRHGRSNRPRRWRLAAAMSTVAGQGLRRRWRTPVSASGDAARSVLIRPVRDRKKRRLPRHHRSAMPDQIVATARECAASVARRNRERQKKRQSDPVSR